MPKKIKGKWRFEEGEVIGNWMVLSPDRTGKRNEKIRCRCKCGNVMDVDVMRLTKKRKPDHCMKCPTWGVPSARKDILGQRFGRLKVIKQEWVDGENVCTCQCDCGNIATLKGKDLIRGVTRSCGCLKAEIQSKKGKLFEKYREENNEYFFQQGTNLAVIKGKIKSDNTSGYKGVYHDKNRDIYQAYINFRNQRFTLGSYKDKSEAVLVRRIAEILIHDRVLRKSEGEDIEPMEFENSQELREYIQEIREGLHQNELKK